MDLPQQPRNDLQLYPEGSGIVTIGGAMMIVGACAPWIGDRLFGMRAGLHLGGDGWLVVFAAIMAVLPLFFALPRGRARGFWVVGFALAAAYVCLTHYQEADADGLRVMWGLEFAAAGTIVAAIGGLRLLTLRRD